MSSHPPTRAYVDRRSKEGLSKKETIRAVSLEDYRFRGPDGRAAVPRSRRGMASLPSRHDGQF
jgi:hypothetical protein